ncbi:methyltransferase domain-containing protein [Thermosulfuriphilus sp.]
MEKKILKKRLKSRFAKAFPFYDQQAWVQEEMAEELTQALADLQISFKLALEIGSGTGLLTRKARRMLSIDTYLASDIVLQAAPYLKELPVFFVVGDGEDLSWIRKNPDLILSNATFQWFLKLDKALETLAQRLAPGGLLAFTTFGPGTMVEVFEAGGQSPWTFIEAEEIRSLARGLFQPLIEKAWEKRLYFDSPREILRHIRATGASGYLPPRWSLKALRAWEAKYQERTTPRGLPLTYRPLLFVWERR